MYGMNEQNEKTPTSLNGKKKLRTLKKSEDH